MFNKVQLWWPSWLAGGVIGYNSKRGSPKDHFKKVWFKLSKLFQMRRYFNEFPIGTNVKLSSAVAAILVDGRGHRIQF